MNDFDKLFSKGYSIKQINEILKTSGDEKTTICLLSPAVPDILFKKIRETNNIDIRIILKLNEQPKEILDSLIDDKKSFEDFILEHKTKKGCRTFASHTPLIFDAFEHKNMIIIGSSGTGKSFSGLFKI